MFELPSTIDVDYFNGLRKKVVATVPILRTRIVDLFDHDLVQVETDESVSWQEGNDFDTYVRIDKDLLIGPGC